MKPGTFSSRTASSKSELADSRRDGDCGRTPRHGLRVVALCAALVASAAAGCSRERMSPVSNPGTTAASPGSQVLAIAPGGETLVLERARTDDERARGLMNRTEVPAGTGMFFEFEAPGRHSFWMFNCLVPLDIIWIDDSGVVVDVSENTPPCPALPCTSYFPRVSASAVIELAAGEARRLRLLPGARVVVQRLPARGGGL